MSEQVTGDAGRGDQIPGRLTEVGSGWHPLLMRLHSQLLGLAVDYRVEEFASRLGGLRLYLQDRFDSHGEFDGDWADTAGALVEVAEREAERTCEECAAPGRPRFHGDRHRTWIRTVCDRCHARPWPGGSGAPTCVRTSDRQVPERRPRPGGPRPRSVRRRPAE
ncbi:hypothetical protein [Streptomyces sp. NPDC006879]|uniref:hypothetical protein n=1 Tax=Streptomyces sp. NPDC006879 TaxID=3364767 RepID=UPI00367DEC7D